MADRKQPDDRKDLPLAGEHELHQDPPPPRADASDQMRRRYSDTMRPEEPSNVAPEEEEEGHHADPGEGRTPIDDGLENEFPGRGRE